MRRLVMDIKRKMYILSESQCVIKAFNFEFRVTWNYFNVAIDLDQDPH